MAALDFGSSGINGILNSASSGVKMKITSIPIEDIIRNENNEYSIESVDSLAASIRDVGLRQPIEVQRLPDGLYKLIGGERRLTAMRKLLDEGDTRWQMIPAIVTDTTTLELPLPDELKELYALTTTNAEQREKTDHDRMLDVENMRRIYSALREAGHELDQHQREFIAQGLGMSESKVQRLGYLSDNLIDGFKGLLREEKLPVTVATSLAKLPEADQDALLEKAEADPDSFNQGTILIYMRRKKEQEQEQRDREAKEIVIDAAFCEELREKMRTLENLLKRTCTVQKTRSAKLLRLQKRATEALQEMCEIVELAR